MKVWLGGGPRERRRKSGKEPMSPRFKAEGIHGSNGFVCEDELLSSVESESWRP